MQTIIATRWPVQARHRYAYSRGFPPKVHRHIKILKVYLEVVINENMVEARISTEFRSNVLRERMAPVGTLGQSQKSYFF